METVGVVTSWSQCWRDINLLCHHCFEKWGETNGILTVSKHDGDELKRGGILLKGRHEMSLSFRFGAGRRIQDAWMEPWNAALTYSGPETRGSHTWPNKYATWEKCKKKKRKETFYFIFILILWYEGPVSLPLSVNKAAHTCSPYSMFYCFMQLDLYKTY